MEDEAAIDRVRFIQAAQRFGLRLREFATCSLSAIRLRAWLAGAH